MRVLTILMGLAGLAVVAAACEGTTAEPTEDEQSVVINASEFKFEPAAINAQEGKKIRVTVRNTGSTPHDFTIAALNVKSPMIDPGKSMTVEFTPKERGTFEFMCDVPGHEASGMKGELRVTPGS